jgi:amino acid transporter
MGEANVEEPGGTSEPNEEAYSGLFGAIPYAFGSSRSWLLKSYVVIGGLVALLAAILIALSLVTLVSRTATAGGGSLTLSRAFFVLIGLAVVGPLLAPILFVARRHRRVGDEKRYDTSLALAGYLFFAALYVGLVITIPAGQQEAVSGALAGVVEFLYALPQLWGLVPPVCAAVGIYLVHRLMR